MPTECTRTFCRFAWLPYQLATWPLHKVMGMAFDASYKEALRRQQAVFDL